MARDVIDDTPIASPTELVAWFAEGCKPPGEFKIGAEHEKFPFYRADLSPPPYEGRDGRGGIRALLEGLAGEGGWDLITDRGALIGLYGRDTGAAVSLEPGGQFELSGGPLATVHETAAELDRHLKQSKRVAARHDIGFMGLGMTPTWTRSDMPAMPKSRYAIMADYMPRVGQRGLDMMFRTCTVQVNLDYASESDMVKKLRVSLALQPLVTALFANSPFTDGRPNGFLSARSEIWRHTDAARTGMLPFAFDPDMGFERYVAYALDVPMYFVKRGDVYHNVAGSSFRDLLSGRLPQLPGQRATIADWVNHLSTIFPEVRLKRYLEMRGADAGDRDTMLALPALFAGLLYDSDALEGAWDLVKSASVEDQRRAREEAPRLGLQANFGRRSLRQIGQDVLALAHKGLQSRNLCDAQGRNERVFLAPLDDVLASGRVPAQRWLDRYENVWRGRIEPIFEEAAL